VKLDATNVIAEANEANNVAFNGLVYVESAGPPGCPW
jgi:subtilase family serine protease